MVMVTGSVPTMPLRLHSGREYPSSVAFFPFAGEIGAVDSVLSSLATAVGTPLASVKTSALSEEFEARITPNAEHAILGVGEITLESSAVSVVIAVNAAETDRRGRQMGVFVEQNLFVAGDPVGVHVEFALRAAFCGDDFALENRAHFWSLVGLDGVGSCSRSRGRSRPLVEPEPGVMRMVNAFRRALFERKSASDGWCHWRCGAGREPVFSEWWGQDVECEGFPSIVNIDFGSGFIDDDADVIFFFWRFWLASAPAKTTDVK